MDSVCIWSQSDHSVLRKLNYSYYIHDVKSKLINVIHLQRQNLGGRRTSVPRSCSAYRWWWWWWWRPSLVPAAEAMAAHQSRLHTYSLCQCLHGLLFSRRTGNSPTIYPGRQSRDQRGVTRHGDVWNDVINRPTRASSQQLFVLDDDFRWCSRIMIIFIHQIHGSKFSVKNRENSEPFSVG